MGDLADVYAQKKGFSQSGDPASWTDGEAGELASHLAMSHMVTPGFT